MEAEYDQKLADMQARHSAEPAAIGGSATEEANAPETEPEPAVDEAAEAEKQRMEKMEKARRKREKQREKEQRREQEIAEATANAGPAPRDVENERIMEQLAPLNLQICEVAADGHCLYRAVAAHVDMNYAQVRT